MRTLCLLRHAKSSWDDPTLDDHDRLLAPRGRRASATMANYLRERKGCRPPELILCSTACRARQTLDIIISAWAPAPPVRTEAGLYLCDADGLLDRLRALPDALRHVLLIGHNPGLQDLALRLAASGDTGTLSRLRRKFPTAGFVDIGVPDSPWGELGDGLGHVRTFTVPRRLG